MHQGFTWPAPWVVRHMMFRSPLIPIAMNQISLYILCPAPCNCNVPIPLIVSVAELSREKDLVTMRTSTIWKVLVFSLALQVAAMRMNAEAAISCSTVISDLVPCLSYVTGSAANPTAACCNGVKALNAAAQTTPDRQAACKCIKSAAASYKYNSGRAGKIPGLCGVNVGFPISASTNCNAIS